MAQIIIEIPDNKLQLVVDAVNSVVNPDLTPAQVQVYVKERLSNELRGFLRTHQEAMWMSTFIYYDPVLPNGLIAPFPASAVVSTTLTE